MPWIDLFWWGVRVTSRNLRSVSVKDADRVTICTHHTDRKDPTNRNTLCPGVIMRCTLRMCWEYGLLVLMTVFTDFTIRKLLLTVRKGAAVLEVTGRFAYESFR